MEFANPGEVELKVAARYRVFLILWVAILASLGFLLALALFLPGSGLPNRTLSYAFFAISIGLILISLLIRQRQLRLAIEKQRIDLLQGAYVVSFALCEAASLFGLLDHFVTGSGNYRFIFGLAFLGMLLHFPKKDHVRAVSYQRF
jgi:hypothetical protein